MSKVKLNLIDVSVELEGEESTSDLTNLAISALAVLFQDRLKLYEYEPDECADEESSHPSGSPQESVPKIQNSMYR